MISPASNHLVGELPESIPTFTVGIPIRVSSAEQADPEKNSLPIQEKECIEYCKSQGWQIYRIYKDVCPGSIPVEERAGGGQLIEDIEAGRLNLVLVWDYDRIQRSKDGLVGDIFRAKMRDLGVQIFSLHQPTTLKNPAEFKEDPFDEGAILLEKIHDWQSSSTVLKFIRRSMMGKEAEARKGRMLAPPNYGYKLEPKKDANGQIIFDKRARVIRVRVKDEKEADTVLRIYNEYVVNGKSDREIAFMLNVEGIPSKKGGLWDRQVVARILKNLVYPGFAIYKKSERRRIRNGKTTYKVNPKDKWIIVGPDKSEHPAIIDLKLWDKAQQIRESKKRFASPSIYAPILFSGLLVCGHCSNIMYRDKVNDYYVQKTTGKKVKYVHLRYLCSKWVRFKKCQKNHISENSIKQLVLEELKRFRDDPEALKGFLNEEQNKNLKQDEQILISKKKAFEQIQTRQGRAYIAYERGSISIDAYNKRKDELESEENQLKEDIGKLEIKLANDKLRQATRESFVEAVDKLDEIFSGDNNIPAQKRFLQSIIERIIVTGNKIDINYWLGSEV